MKSVLDSTPFTAILSQVRSPDTADFHDAWCGMEPTFTNRQAIKLWEKLSADDTDAAEDRFFKHPYMLKMEKRAIKAMEKKYKTAQRRGEEWCLFDRVERAEDLDQWAVGRQNLHFSCRGDKHVFTVRFGMDPETWEFSIKPVPIAWLYDARFVRFLQEIVFDVPQDLGLIASIGHGGCQFSLSVKTYLGGTLLCDDIADKFNHPELSSWLFDYPNCDDRCFRATAPRRAAFAQIIDQYWQGAFHPRAIGRLTVENAYRDYGFGPCLTPPPGLISTEGERIGPVGSAEEVFQTNFAFGRAVRLYAQNVHPGYWQNAHPDSQGYRPDQIMRYSEGNLNRLRIHGELHVKSDVVLDPSRVAEYDAPLISNLLYEEASWENRAQYCRTSAHDFVEAILHDVHRAQYLQKHPGVKPRLSLLQDQILGDAEDTLVRNGGGEALEVMRRKARKATLESSNGRIKSSFVEPEDLFWASWHALPINERAAIAREVVNQFVLRVQETATCDPRRTADSASGHQTAEDSESHDPMHWHRHRIHPLLWETLQAEPSVLAADDPARHELTAFMAHQDRYLNRRPVYSPSKKLVAPWDVKK